MNPAKSGLFEAFFDKHEDRRLELLALREILEESGLEADVKWGLPTYTWKGKNVLSLGAFKSYVGIWFFQGAFLSDGGNFLVNAQAGKTKGMRQWRFQSLAEVETHRARIAEYCDEAKANAQAGKEIKPERRKADMPVELLEVLSGDAVLRACYDELTPGRQREYCEFIGLAKREATRYSRLAKCILLIKKGVGLNDLYR